MISRLKKKIRQRTKRATINSINALLLLIASVFDGSGASAQQPNQFWEVWGDGKGELNLYSSEIPRYGEIRSGHSILIYVTEDFSPGAQVKKEKEEPGDLKVMKLNHVKKFITGTYDYSIMTSVFSPLTVWSIGRRSFEAILPIKVSFSSQEWCGNYYEQLNSRVDGYERTVHSYFEGEGDVDDFLKHRSHAIQEDDLFIRVRELVAPFPHGEYWMLSSPFYSRLMHEDTKWIRAAVKREAVPETLLVPFGTFKARKFTVTTSAREHRFWVEDQLPKRLLKWEVELSGNPAMTERSLLVSSKREPYWEQNKVGFEYLREALGIPLHR